MTRDLSGATLNNIEDDVVYPFYAVEMLFDGAEVLRLWTGTGTLNFEGEDWFGTGDLLAVDLVEETSELDVKGAQVTLSGVPTTLLSLALSEPYQGRRCNIYLGTFAKGNLLLESGSYILLEDGSRILLEDQDTGLTEIFSGYMDQMNIQEEPDTCTISLSVENRLLDLERIRVARYTNSYQKSKFPNDDGLAFVEDLQTRELVWGAAGDNPSPQRTTGLGATRSLITSLLP